MGYGMDAYYCLYRGACPNLLAAKAGTGENPCHNLL